ncbi:unnamed protein product [Adineta ricciae]|uniref:Uncharacterized protein n=1 Tax=Adineta ricciae TaxID=249248 RepID=A0A815DJ09_ADIRI|nr:unnamed protein product [Adineta ricciae]
MKYSLRKSFNSRRRKDIAGDDDQINPRNDHPVTSSNSHLVKSKQSKSFLRRRRYSSSPPRSSSPNRNKTKTSEHPYNNHINDEDDDDDPFSTSANSNPRLRPFDKLTDQIRKSFRNTLTRQRSRLESNNSNKRLIFKSNDENHPVNPLISPISTGLTSPITLPVEKTTDTSDNTKLPPKRRKAPLAPTHMNQSKSVPNPECSTLNITDQQESGYISSPNDSQTKKTKFNRSFRAQISLLFKKRHAKQQQIVNCLDDDLDHQHHDDQDDAPHKKQTFAQRFDTLRRSLHLGKRNSLKKGTNYLLSNE